MTKQLSKLSPAMCGLLEHLYENPRTSSRHINSRTANGLGDRGLADVVKTFPDGSALWSLTAKGRAEYRERIRRNGGETPATEPDSHPKRSQSKPAEACPRPSRCRTHGPAAPAETDGLSPAGIQLAIEEPDIGANGANLAHWRQIQQLVNMRADADALQKVGLLTRIVAEAEEARAELVARARLTGSSWSALGDALGVSKQAAQMRYGKKA
jgi:hypothetical protein